MAESYWALHRVSRRKALGAGALAAGAISAMACSRSGSGAPAGSSQLQQESPKPGGTLNVFWTANPVLDPQKGSSPPMQAPAGVMSRLYRFKTGIDPKISVDHDIEPDLTASAESPDAVTWTIKLRPDARFHNVAPVNGHAVEAEDIEGTFTRMLDPATSAPNRGAVTMIDPNQIQTPDKTTVVFKLAYPFAPFQNMLASPPYSMIYPREVLTGAYDPARKVIGSGPYMLDSATPDVALVYKKNPDYFEKGFPYIDQIRLAIIEDTSQQLAQFNGGNLDELWMMTNDDLASMKQRNPKALVVKAENATPFPIYVRLDDPASPFHDVRVRRAISMSIDRDAIGKAVYGGDYQLPVFVPSYMGKWAAKVGDLDANTQQYYKFNPAEAKKLLDAAGATGMSVKVIKISGGPFNAPYLKKHSEAIYNFVQSAGFKATLVEADYAKDFLDAGRGIKQGFYDKDAIALAAVASFTDPDEFLFSYFHSKSTSNTERLNDPALDAMIDKERTLLNAEERRKSVFDIQKYIADQMYAPSTVGTYNWVMVQPRVRNYQYTSTPARVGETYAKAWVAG
jgi:peptide/nickel transport system substrate-binding protein